GRFEYEPVNEVDGLKDRYDLVVAVGPAADDLEAEVQFGRRGGGDGGAITHKKIVAVRAHDRRSPSGRGLASRPGQLARSWWMGWSGLPSPSGVRAHWRVYSRVACGGRRTRLGRRRRIGATARVVAAAHG